MKNINLSGNLPKKGFWVEIIASLLLVFFVHSAISTYVNLQSLKNMLAFYTVYRTAVAWIIVALEMIIALLLFIPRSRGAGFSCATLFGLLAIVVIIRTPHYPHDFGGIINSFGFTNQKYFLYGVLVFLGLLGVIITIKKSTKKPFRDQSNVVFT